MADVFAKVVGQERAVTALRSAAANPVHAYLLVGPPGVGKEEAAKGFAASILCDRGGCGECEDCLRVLGPGHPDVIVTERTGAALQALEAKEIVRVANTSATEKTHKVMVLPDFHLAEGEAPKLLKTIEEPPASTMFVVLADQIPPGLTTIASRCVRVDFVPLDAGTVAEVLRAEGVDGEVADELSQAAGGRLDRARYLAQDQDALERHRTWRSIPDRLNGSGASVVQLVEKVRDLTESVLAPIRAQHEQENEQARADAERYGTKPPPAAETAKRQNRELRRLQTDEVRSGLSSLASTYRSRLETQPKTATRALDLINDTVVALTHNPNEPLLLQSLLVRLSRLL